jgi:hypothetical protein
MSTPLIQLDRKKTAKKAAPAKATVAAGKTTVGFVNLGCSKNQVDSELMLGTLVHDGFQLTDNPKKAEVVTSIPVALSKKPNRSRSITFSNMAS